MFYCCPLNYLAVVSGQVLLCKVNVLRFFQCASECLLLLVRAAVHSEGYCRYLKCLSDGGQLLTAVGVQHDQILIAGGCGQPGTAREVLCVSGAGVGIH